jgi:hypothetical protein
MALAGAVIIAGQPKNKTNATPKKRSRLDPLRFPDFSDKWTFSHW